jgi:hypothetical protein
VFDGCLCDSNLLGYLAPMIVRIVVVESGLAKKRSADSGTDNRLLESAVLALCKFMCVSSEFCSKHLQVSSLAYR